MGGVRAYGKGRDLSPQARRQLPDSRLAGAGGRQAPSGSHLASRPRIDAVYRLAIKSGASRGNSSGTVQPA